MENNREGLAEQIFLEYKPRIYGYLHNKNIAFSDVDDVFADIMLKATTYIESYDSCKASLSTWVYTICRSVVINYWKRSKPELPLTEEQSSGFDLERTVEIGEELRELAHHLSRLPDRERKVIVLRLYQEMGYCEIAQAMGLSEGNVRVLFSRACKKLREWMKTKN